MKKQIAVSGGKSSKAQGTTHSGTWMQIHGTMVEIDGVGILLLGDSGIGKSEAALELISRGHKLIADDAVMIRNEGEAGLRASACPVTSGVLEIRGLGIIDVRKVFGNSALSEDSLVSLCVRLNQGEFNTIENRLDPALKTEIVAGVEIPTFEIPVKSGRNIPVLLETAVRILNQRTNAESDQ